ncbi:hypothetical protein E2974_05195 [Paracoccus yeei]|uniref:hypothetical protein n=1 Tax=Paracoccus yeei TaxID=147645 RepID=UPI003BF866F0
MAKAIFQSIVLASFTLLGCPVLAQMKPLDEVLSSPGYNESYPFVRCSSLFLAMSHWFGSKGEKAEAFDRYQSAASQMLQIAEELRQEKEGMSAEAAKNGTLRDAENIITLYMNRFEQNYATHGAIFEFDEGLQADINNCKFLAWGS